jgi:hypothetical protein
VSIAGSPSPLLHLPPLPQFFVGFLVVQQWIRTNRRKTVDIKIKDMNPSIKRKRQMRAQVD